MKLAEIKEAVIDLIFPKFCLGCEKEGDWLCISCRNKVVKVVTQVCPECGRVSRFGRYCRRHQKSWGLSGIITATYYKEGPIKEVVHNFKYNHLLELGDFLGVHLVRALKENHFTSDKLLITAVPLHFWRRAGRGYNQSEILATYVAEKFLDKGQAFKLSKNFKILRKIRQTKSQVKFSGKKRRENLKNSFIFNKKINISGRTIIIVDDITTTGTTLNECAKVLRRAGAKKVWGLVVAKG